MLGLIFFSLLFGYFIPKIDPQPAQVMLAFWNGVFQVMMKITHLVMRALPIGVFGLVAKVRFLSLSNVWKNVPKFLIVSVALPSLSALL